MFWTGKRVLLSGSSGFAGKYLSGRLEAAGAKIIKTGRSAGIDLRNWDEIKNLTDIDFVYHLAAMVGVAPSWNSPREVLEFNYLSTLNLLELCRRNQAKMVFASSYVYGAPQYVPIDENHPLNPSNPYAQSKLLGENLCRSYQRDFGVQSIILRIFNIFGPGQPRSSLISNIIGQLEKSGRIRLKDPKPVRDYVYIEDVVEAYLKAGAYKHSRFEIFNIGFGKSISVEKLVRKIVLLTGRKVITEYSGETRPNEVTDIIADISKARSLLRWSPQISLVEGLTRIIRKV